MAFDPQDPTAPLPPDRPGARLGPYRLLERIGSGGMGVVWAAEQERPMRRRVAIKLVKRGMDSREALVRDTHNFESRYPFQLVAPYPEKKEVYVERSPVHFVERASFPLLIQQGSEDPVVPRNQAVSMVEALEKAGKTVRYMEFEGEGHGFRRAENIVASIEGELDFYAGVLGLGGAD